MDSLWYGLIGVIIGSIPLWYKMFAERKEIDAKIKNLDANTDKTAVESLRIALDETNERLTSLKQEVQDGIMETTKIEEERNQAIKEMHELKAMVRELIRAMRAYVRRPHDESVMLALLDEAEAKL
jgi:predicted  nucleic acid-binding Zn-ribbon protein